MATINATIAAASDIVSGLAISNNKPLNSAKTTGV